jgi:hypothetical protein
MTIQTIDNGVTLYTFRTAVNANFAELSTLATGKYAKPSTGIPAVDLDASTQTLLGKANTAFQPDGAGKLPASALPDLAIVQFLGTVSSQAAMLALVGQRGDWCIRSDDAKVYILTADAPSVIGSWQGMSYPTGGTPVATTSSTGTVTLAAAGDITAGTAGRVVDAAQLKAQNDTLNTALSGKATSAQGTKADNAQPKTAIAAGTALGATKATADADDGGTFTAAVAGAVTVHSGAVAGFGFGVSGAGVVTFAGASGVTVSDKRTSGATNPVCALVQVGANAYEVWGSKA